MSIRVMSTVWDRADAKGSALLLLLALADYANDEGGDIWPSVQSLARKIRMSERQTTRLLGDLEAAGMLEITEREGRSNRYRLTIMDTEARQNTPDKLSGVGVTSCQGGGDKLSGGGDIAMSGGGCHSYVRGSVLDPSQKHVVVAREDDEKNHPEGTPEQIMDRLTQLGVNNPGPLADRTDLMRLDHYEALASAKTRPAGYIAECIRQQVEPPDAWARTWRRQAADDARLTAFLRDRAADATRAMAHWRDRTLKRTGAAPGWMTLEAVLADPGPEGRKRRRSLTCLIDPNQVRERAG